MRGRDAAIAVVANQSIQDEPGAHGRHPSGDGSIERQRKGQRPDSVRRNGRDDASFDDRFARAGDIEPLQVAQAAVDRPEVVEGRAAPEVGALDERHRQAALRGVVGDGQAVDAAADDKDVEGTTCELVKVSPHCRL